MPTVTVNKLPFLEGIGEKDYADHDVELLSFDFGIELDEVTSDRKELEKERGSSLTAAEIASVSDEVTYKFDIPANRYDLLCLEGLVRGLRVFMEKDQPPLYKAVAPKRMQQMFVKEAVDQVRPFVVCAILRDLYFTNETLKSFMQLQDKLHQNICRERSLVSVGTHDLDTVSGPYVYDARPPQHIKFVPLDQTKAVDGHELMELYSTHKLRKYLPIIKDKPVYPVVLDKNEVVMSLPPIINGDHSKITVNTKNVLIEATCTDRTKAGIVVDTLICMFSQYCKVPFSYEPVEVIYPDGRKDTHEMKYRDENVTVDYITNRVGVKLDAETISKLLNKMYLKAKPNNKDGVVVTIPPSRADILHPCDIMEDVAIAYGYNNLVKTIPTTNTIGEQLPINKISDLLRLELAMAGFTEALTLCLISHDEYFKNLGKEDKNDLVVKIENPASQMFQIVRPSLIPGILKTIGANKSFAKPIQIFEISDVVVKDDKVDVGARNYRHLCVGYYGVLSGLEIINGVLDRIMSLLKVPLVAVGQSNGYYVQDSNDAMFFPARRAEVFINNKKVGSFGIVHPNVMAPFDITSPCSILELNIQQFENYTSTRDVYNPDDHM